MSRESHTTNRGEQRYIEQTYSESHQLVITVLLQRKMHQDVTATASAVISQVRWTNEANHKGRIKAILLSAALNGGLNKAWLYLDRILQDAVASGAGGFSLALYW
jgi:hypothetical protein